MIRAADVGQVCESNQLIELVRLAEKLLVQIEQDGDLSSRCRYLFESEFAVENTVRQIVSALAAERQSI
jgi:hypothetical protein